MKKHISVFMLMARSSVYGLLGVLIAMAAAEGALFYFALNKTLADERAGSVLSGLERVLSESGIIWGFGAFFLLFMALLCATGCEFGSRQGYTLGRLSISERSIFAWQAVYNCVCLFVLWAAQLGIVLALIGLYDARVSPEAFSGQSAFLAFYRNSFLHSLLPLEEGSRYIRNIVLIFGLGISAAVFPFKQRRGKWGWEAAALAAACLASFSGETGGLGGDVFLILLSVSLAAFAAAFVFKREDENEA